MNALHQMAVRQIEVRGGKVFTFDRGASIVPVLNAHAQRKLQRMLRHGSRKVKVAVRSAIARSWTPSEAVALVRIAARQGR